MTALRFQTGGGSGHWTFLASLGGFWERKKACPKEGWSFIRNMSYWGFHCSDKQIHHQASRQNQPRVERRKQSEMLPLKILAASEGREHFRQDSTTLTPMSLLLINSFLGTRGHCTMTSSKVEVISAWQLMQTWWRTRAARCASASVSSLCAVSLACSMQQKQQQVMISKPVYALNPFTVLMLVENDNNSLKLEMKSLCIFLFFLN